MTLEEVMEVLDKDSMLKMQVYQKIEREFHKDDIIDWMNSCLKEPIVVTEKEMEYLLNRYEKYLSNCDDWSVCLDELMHEFIEEKCK
jgi:hypothetical protein